MLVAHPAVLSELLERYERYRAQSHGTGGTATVQRAFDDVCYTLCVTTGTREVAEALTVARTWLSSTLAGLSTTVASGGTPAGTPQWGTGES